MSNYPDLRAYAQWHGVPYHHLPVRPATRNRQEAELFPLFEKSGADYLVLARYMQVLSPSLARRLSGRCINIHHSFLPSLKGAGPYRRAHKRDVKLIGATAHLGTGDLMKGRHQAGRGAVNHRAIEQNLVRMGQDIEARVLARAVRWIAERRVLLNGVRTVVFR